MSGTVPVSSRGLVRIVALPITKTAKEGKNGWQQVISSRNVWVLPEIKTLERKACLDRIPYKLQSYL